jgi:hypothetical protein
MKQDDGGAGKTGRAGPSEIGRAVKRSVISRSPARKAAADSVIKEARIELSRIDIGGFDEETARAVVAAVEALPSRVSDLTPAERQRLRDRVGALLESIVRSGSAAAQSEFLQQCRLLDVEPSAIAEGVIRAAVLLSNIVRATTLPWHHDVSRRFGIVCRSDGFPIVTPRLLDGEVLGACVDELEHRAIPTASYSIPDHDGDVHEVRGPAADAGVGKVSIERLRAWRGVSLAKFRKEMELLPEPARRSVTDRFGPDWPFPTALPGLSDPGVRGADKSVDIVVYLSAEKFGAAPSNPLDDNEQDEADQEVNDIPRLPEGLRAGSGELVLRGPRQPKSGGKS